MYWSRFQEKKKVKHVNMHLSCVDETECAKKYRPEEAERVNQMRVPSVKATWCEHCLNGHLVLTFENSTISTKGGSSSGPTRML